MVMDLSIKPKLGNITAELGEISVFFNTMKSGRDQALAANQKLQKENKALQEENKKLKAKSSSEEVKDLQAKVENLKKEQAQNMAALKTKLKG